MSETEINLIFHPSNSVLAGEVSFCLKQRCFPITVGIVILIFKKIEERFIWW